MYNTSRDFSLRTFDDATRATCASCPTPSESPICSPLIFSSTALADNLLQLNETLSSSAFEPLSLPSASLSSPCFADSIPLDHSPSDPSAEAETFYTPQGIGEDAPLHDITPILLLQSNSPPIVPSVNAVNPTSPACPSFTGSELSELTACSLASVGSPIAPSLASVILSSGDTAQAAYSSFRHSRYTSNKVLSIYYLDVLDVLLT